MVMLPLSILLRPAILEEILFRALLLPRNIRQLNKLALVANCIAALALFVISHPLHGWLTRPSALGLFTNPVFLTCAALLGAACTVTYLISRSIWPPVLLHWISVVVWILFLGGQALTGRGTR
jgi:predicted Abi (CAAX) family protease